MIDSFMGEYRFLSNFHESPIHYNGVTYKNSESAYQAQKFSEARLRFGFDTTSGKEAKQKAKKQKAFIRADWLKVNLGIMSEIIHAKFTQDKAIRQLLILTYPHELIEGNDWGDVFWGVCKGQGQNWLGRILMAERVYWLDLMANKYKLKEKANVPA